MHHLLHHANCADGFAAACIARHALLHTGCVNVQPVNYGDPNQMPLGKDGILFPGDTVTYLDYTPPQETIDAFFAEHGDSMIPLTIIDHHSSAAIRHGRDKDTGQPLEWSAGTHARWETGPLESISGAPPIRFKSIFKLHHSGAALTWFHFFPADPLPEAVALIQWRDLGYAFDPKLKDHHYTAPSLNLHAYLFRCLPRTIEAWTSLLLDSTVNQVNNSHPPSTSLRHALDTGARLREIDRSIILSAVANPHWLNFHGDEIPAVNGLDAGLISDACTELLRKYPTAPFAASWFINPKTGEATYSLRSRRDSTVNVADIAAAMAPGGGGHPNAAGFSTLHPIPFV